MRYSLLACLLPLSWAFHPTTTWRRNQPATLLLAKGGSAAGTRVKRISNLSKWIDENEIK
jgi:hypothetical protein